MKEQEFYVKLQLRIDWSEMDYFKHVNNVSFFKYIQSARVNYWDQVGINQIHHETNIGPILASSKCDFKKPLFYPGNVTILSRVNYIKNTSFGIFHQLLDDNNTIVAEAQDVIVMYDFNINEKIQIPSDLKEKIEQLEQISF